ncbi:MAG: PDZ domain-containing protein [Alphaproteobacteria bacterium]|nr:PDZ domain-containing protein [Alphaproteobacteria bacterium]
MKNFFRIFVAGFVWLSVATSVFADNLFFEDQPIQNGINVFNMSRGFAEIYEKLAGVKWGGKDIRVAIEGLENLHSKAHIAATDERVVLVWGDTIVGNYPAPEPRDWNAYGEITTALVLKIRERDASLAKATESDIYRAVVDALMRGIDENGRYILSTDDSITNDGRILTSVGIEGARDERGNFRVLGVYKGSPADSAGVRDGDLIGEINGTLVSDISDSALASMMSGFNSGTVKMTLLTPSGQRRVVVRRATIVIADADIVFMDDANGGILDIIVNKISDNAVDIVKEALNKHPNVAGVILDLRVADGDDERAAAKLAGLFIGQKPIMRIVENKLDEIEVVSADNAVTGAHVVVVVSNMTRGTAEAVASAFYENGRGVLIGTPTAGTARIASKLMLSDGGALELLNKSVKTGQGHVIDRRGVFPVVCLSNIRTGAQQSAFFINVVNGDFRFHNYNADKEVDAESVRRGCPVITNGEDEDLLAMAIAVQILTDSKVYSRLLNYEE